MIDVDALPESFFEYVDLHHNDDPHKLLFSTHKGKYNFPIDFAITQIQARQKIKNKLLGFPLVEQFLFASTLLAEQCTAWPIAQFHASLLREGKGMRVADLTCGLGIDAFSFCRMGADVIAIDIDTLTSQCASHNANLMSIKNFQSINADAIQWMENEERKFDMVFVDPARRKNGNRAYNLHDCSPDIVAHIHLLRCRTPRVMVKASPMLDITATLKLIPEIAHLYIVALNGECKEILADIKFEPSPRQADVTAINLDAKGEAISKFHIRNFLETRNPEAPLAETDDISEGAWLAEPDAAVMKTGAWANLASLHPGMLMLHPHTHLFISDKKPEGFPGRTRQIKRVWKSIKDAHRSLKGERINVATRNYPLSAAQLEKKLSVMASDNSRSFIMGATSSALGKILLELVSENDTAFC